MSKDIYDGEYAGMKIVNSPHVPPGEIVFVIARKEVGRIVNVGRPGAACAPSPVERG